MPTYETKGHQGNSTGTSSNNSLIINGMSDCDLQNSSETDRNSICNEITNDYNTATELDNDADTTILSETSTLHGDSNNLAYFMNKCAELERTVGSLKNKLITKEKELTDMQLKQWSSDYLTDQMKTTISRLEKENVHLKAVVVKYSRVNL